MRSAANMDLSKYESVYCPQKGKQELAMNLDVDILIYGGAKGSGKSHLLRLKPLLYKDDPYFNGIIFRRNTNQLTGKGGIWEETKDLWNPIIKHAKYKGRIREQDREIIFKNGFAMKMSHLDHEKDKKAHMGKEYTMIGFDELTHFTETQFLFLLDSLRSKSKKSSFVVATCNPDASSWVFDWVEPYLDEAGYPREEMCGKILYFYIIKDKPVFSEDKEYLQREFPDLYEDTDELTGETYYSPPMSFSFVNGTCRDNPIMLRQNPGYISKLKAGSIVDRERYLKGNWKIRPEGSNFFDRTWLHKETYIPPGSRAVRAWDIAATAPSEKNWYPDYTACIKLYKTPQDKYILAGDFDDSCKEAKGEILGRFRLRPGERDDKMLKQAEYDGGDVRVIIPKDSAAAGVQAAEIMLSSFINLGFLCWLDKTERANKLKKFEPFSSAAQNGMVSIIEPSFPNKQTLNAFYSELEGFDGSPSTKAKKDDWVDCVSSAFNNIQKLPVYDKFILPTSNAPTKGANYIRDIRNITGSNHGTAIGTKANKF